MTKTPMLAAPGESLHSIMLSPLHTLPSAFRPISAKPLHRCRHGPLTNVRYENRYPGCACDIPSVVYQFPWRPKPWSRYYSYSPEIWEYIKEVEQENNFIQKYIKLRHKITAVSWSDDSAQWTVSLTDLKTGVSHKPSLLNSPPRSLWNTDIL